MRRSRAPVRAGLLLAMLLAGWASTTPALAATGCDLNHPDSDVPRLMPGSTRYETRYLALRIDQLAEVVTRLDERFRALYEPLGVPYTLYEVFRGERKIGYVHGVNQKGRFGGIQVFLALDLEGRITAFYIQKMSGVSAAKLRSREFAHQFEGLTLGDVLAFDTETGTGTGRVAAITNPAPDMETDFYSVLRALKKNLVLMDVLVYRAAPKAP